MIKQHNGIEFDCKGAFVYYDDHLAKIAEKEADRMAILERLILANAKIDEKDREIERLINREGNAHIEIIVPTNDDPFRRFDLKVCDFGVADNCYVAECPEVENEIATLRLKLEKAENNIRSLIDFFPDGWDVPLLFSQLVAQIKEETR